MQAFIPIYAQFYDENKNIITKEVSGPGETGIHIIVNENDSKVNIRYYISKIKMAAGIATDWAIRNNLKVIFTTYTFTTDAPNHWWTFQPKSKIDFNENSFYKKKGFGIIIRASGLPKPLNNDKNNFDIDMIPL
jgi:hypothetical protein